MSTAEGIVAMTRRLLTFILSMFFCVHIAGCTSGGSKEEGDAASNDESYALENEGDFSDGDSGDFADESASSDESASDDSEEISLDDSDSSEEAGDGQESSTDVAEGSADDSEELSLDDEGLPEEVASENNQDSSTQAQNDQAPTDEPLFTGEPTDQENASGEVNSMATNDEGANQEPPPPDAEASSDQGGFVDVAEAAEPSAADAAADTAEQPAQSWVPVQKIKTAAFQKNGSNLNRVYIARPGDSMDSISQKVYGANRKQELLNWNSHLNRGVKTGDKVYYSSPVNPGDMAMKTFYDDRGVPSQTYVSKDGDNIRRVSKDLLGSPDSWKEVWATNPMVESKGDIPAGLQLSYWPTGDLPMVAPVPMPVAGMGSAGGFDNHAMAGPNAMEEVSPGTAQNPMPPTMGGMNGQQDPFAPGNDLSGPGSQDPMAMAGNGDSFGGQPDPMAMAQGSVDQGMEVPPPPMQAEPVAPPPPPSMAETAPPIQKKPAQVMSSDTEADPDTVMMLGGGGIILLAGALLFVVIRKNRVKRIDLSQTQV